MMQMEDIMRAIMEHKSLAEESEAAPLVQQKCEIAESAVKKTWRTEAAAAREQLC
jgi:hypothetical protein